MQKNWHEWKKIHAWKDILLESFIVGVCFFSIFFWGMSLTSAGNAAIFTRNEVLFTFLFFGLWQKEKHKVLHMWSPFFLILGILIVLAPDELSFQRCPLFGKYSDFSLFSLVYFSLPANELD